MFRFWELLWVSEPSKKSIIVHTEVMSHKEEKGPFMWEATHLGT